MGNIFSYAVCPLCGRNRVTETHLKGKIRWDFIDPWTSEFIQLREQNERMIGGKSYGFTKTAGTLTILEAYNDPAYKDIVEDMLRQLERLVIEYSVMGLIDINKIVREVRKRKRKKT